MKQGITWADNCSSGGIILKHWYDRESGGERFKIKHDVMKYTNGLNTGLEILRKNIMW